MISHSFLWEFIIIFQIFAYTVLQILIKSHSTPFSIIPHIFIYVLCMGAQRCRTNYVQIWWKRNDKCVPVHALHIRHTKKCVPVCALHIRHTNNLLICTHLAMDGRDREAVSKLAVYWIKNQIHLQIDNTFFFNESNRYLKAVLLGFALACFSLCCCFVLHSAWSGGDSAVLFGFDQKKCVQWKLAAKWSKCLSVRSENSL